MIKFKKFIVSNVELYNICKEINRKNMSVFKKYGVSNKKDNIYTCVCCGKKTCINNSTSIEGAYLVCNRCVYDKFDYSWHNCREWQLKMLREELENVKN